MFEKFNHFAESTATNASRRQFLGRLGRGATAVAAGLGGLLAFPCDAQAARQCPKGYQLYKDPDTGERRCAPKGKNPKFPKNPRV